MVGFKNLLRSIECQNIASSYGIRYYGRGYLDADAFVSYIRYEFLARELINSTLTYVPSLRPVYTNITKMSKYKKLKTMLVKIQLYRKVLVWQYFNIKVRVLFRILNRSGVILKNKPNILEEHNAIEYYDTMHNYTEDLRILQKDLRRKIK